MVRHQARMAAVGTCLLLGSVSPVQAWHLKKQHAHCDTSRADTRADITRSDYVRTSRTVTPGMIYMPMMMPMGMGTRSETDEGSDSLRTAHIAEAAQLRQEQARRILEAEIEASKRILDRMGGPSSASVPSDIGARLDKLTQAVEALNQRVLAVEKLVLIHDNVLRDKVGEQLPLPKTEEDKKDK